MDLNVVTELTPEDLAETLRNAEPQSEERDWLFSMASDIANMAGEEFSDDESLGYAIEALPGYLVLADPAVVRSHANRHGVVDLSESTELSDALHSTFIWEAVVRDIRSKNVSVHYGEREFFWIS
jgi:hypothetical protein